MVRAVHPLVALEVSVRGRVGTLKSRLSVENTRAVHGWCQCTVGIDPAGWAATAAAVVEEGEMRDVCWYILHV